MKKALFFLSFGVLLFSSCEEEALPVNFDKPQVSLKDTTYIKSPASAAQPKVVLLEDFTGASCPPCPKGHVAVHDIIAANPGRVVGVAIHPGEANFIQAAPIHGEPDFNTSWGGQILGIIGKPNGIPYGAADRMEKSILTTSWSQYVTNRLAVPNPVNLELSVISYDAATRELIYEVKVEATENVANVIYFSTMIAEDSIISKQKWTGGVYDPYTHNHILRNMPNFGEALNPNSEPAIVPGRVFIKQYKTTISSEWKADNCKIIAFVHKDIEVVQAAEKHIK